MAERRGGLLRAVRASDIGRFVGLPAGGDAPCAVCGRRIAWSEAGGFVKIRGAVMLFCDKPACLVAVQQGHFGEWADGSAN